MSISSVGTRPAAIQSLLDMRTQLEDLQRQLGTGQKSTNFAGLGVNRGLAVALQSQVTTLSGYADTSKQVDVRLNLAQTALSGISDIRTSAKSSLQQSAAITANGQSIAQQTARGQLDQLLSVLNTQAGDRFMFSGRALDQQSVESADHILDGDGARAGLRQLISERRQADLGANGLGRLTVGAAAGTVSVAEDAAGSPFGFKLVAVNSTLSNATVSGPSGSPAAVSVALSANPAAGESVSLALTMPDGTQTTVKLTATTASPPAQGEFTIGADADATATNLQAALTSALDTSAKTALSAASAVSAANDFFNIDVGNPPRRVAGPPFDTATALVAGTASNTVTWYTGEMGTDPARTTALARVDNTLTISYGMRANEEGIRSIVQTIGVFAATTFSPTDSSSGAAYTELSRRVSSGLSQPVGVQRVDDISVEVANAQSALKDANDRHTQTSSVLSGLLDNIAGAPPEEVASQILTLQTRLQASLQTTASLFKLSLADYI